MSEDFGIGMGFPVRVQNKIKTLNEFIKQFNKQIHDDLRFYITNELSVALAEQMHQSAEMSSSSDSEDGLERGDSLNGIDE
jgi:hypothetical protein